MSACSSGKVKLNCDAVNYISNNSSTKNSQSESKNHSININNGAELKYSHQLEFQQQQQQQFNTQHNGQHVKIENQTTIVKPEYSSIASFQFNQQPNELNDVQKLLKQEQELQKQLYSGSNVAPDWRRVTHNNKIIYISPSGIGLSSLKQVKDYLLTPGTCNCGLPLPLRVELFFNFNTEIPTVPLKAPLNSIQFDPTCLHRKRIITNQPSTNQSDSKRPKLEAVRKLTSVNSDIECSQLVQNKVINQSNNNTVMMVNNQQQPQQMMSQMKPQQVTYQQNQQQQPHRQFIQQQQQQQQLQKPTNVGQQQFVQQKFNMDEVSTMNQSNIVVRIVKEETETTEMQSKMPPWKKNSIINQTQQMNLTMGGGSVVSGGIGGYSTMSGIKTSQPQLVQVGGNGNGIPIYQINGQNIIAIDQQQQQQNVNQTQYQIQQHPQQIQIIDGKQQQIIEDYNQPQQSWSNDDPNKPKLVRRRPTFKEDPTGYLKQQTALLHNSITTLHSPDGSSSNVSTAGSPVLQETPEQFSQRQQQQRQQFIQQYIKSGGSVATTNSNGIISYPATTIGGQTVTHMGNGVVQIQQNCDIPLLNSSQQQQQQQQLPSQQQQQQLTSAPQLQQKPMLIQEQIQMQQNKFIRQSPKGRPPKNPQQKRLVAVSQESPAVSSTSPAALTMNVKIEKTKSNTPDISSSSHTPDMIHENVSTSYDASDNMAVTYRQDSSSISTKFGRTSTTKNSMTSVIAGKTITNTTSAAVRRNQNPQQQQQQQQQQQMQMGIKKTQVMMGKTGGGISSMMTTNNSGAFQNNQQIIMTSNGQQIIVMPSMNQQQPQNIILNNNQQLVQIQNNAGGQQRLIQAPNNNGNIQLIQTSNGNVIATTTNPGNFMLAQAGGQQLFNISNNGNILQNGATIAKTINGNNILLASSAGNNQTKTIISSTNGMGQPMMGQQTVLLNGMPSNVIMPGNFQRMDNQQIIQDATGFIQQTQLQQQQQQQQQQRTITINPEKKKGRKRKIPLQSSAGGSAISIQNNIQQNQTIQTSIPQQQQQQQQQQHQQNLIQMAPQFNQNQGFQFAPNILQLQNKNPQQQQQQIILQNGQTIIQQPVNLLGQQLGQQLMLPSGLMVAPDNSLLQFQNMAGPYNNLISTPQGMMIRAPVPQHQQQQQQQQQKTLITNNGQQFIVNQNGQISPLNQVFNTPMGFIVQHNQQQQQILTQQQQQQQPFIMQQQPQQQIITHTQPQILQQAPQQQIIQQTQLISQQQQQQIQPQFITQNEQGQSKQITAMINQRKIIQHQQQQQQQQQKQQMQQKFYPQLIKQQQQQQQQQQRQQLFQAPKIPMQQQQQQQIIMRNQQMAIDLNNQQHMMMTNVMHQQDDDSDEEECETEDNELIQELEEMDEEEENDNLDDEEEMEPLESELKSIETTTDLEDQNTSPLMIINSGVEMLGDGNCGIDDIDDIHNIVDIRMDEINDINEYLNSIEDDEEEVHNSNITTLTSTQSQQLLQIANSPPDTTTHSPRSPIQLTNDKSSNSNDMFVSSSEPDSVPTAQSPLQNVQSHQLVDPPTFKSPSQPKRPIYYSSPSTQSGTSVMRSPTSHYERGNDKNNKSPLSMRPDSREASLATPEPVMEDTNNDNCSPYKSDFDLLKESPPLNPLMYPSPTKDSAKTIEATPRHTLSPQQSHMPISPALSASPPSQSPTTMLPNCNAGSSPQLNCTFGIGDLVWGEVRGCDAWPGKIVNLPEGEPTPSDCVWVKWFGGRQNTEMVNVNTLKSLSDGLEAHHAAQKDTRKGRKLNSQLERAIQKAMAELDKSSNTSKKTVTKKLLKIAPAPDK